MLYIYIGIFPLTIAKMATICPQHAQTISKSWVFIFLSRWKIIRANKAHQLIWYWVRSLIRITFMCMRICMRQNINRFITFYEGDDDVSCRDFMHNRSIFIHTRISMITIATLNMYAVILSRVRENLHRRKAYTCINVDTKIGLRIIRYNEIQSRS